VSVVASVCINGKMTYVFYSSASFTDSQNDESAARVDSFLLFSADIPGRVRSFVVYTFVIRREDVSE